MFIDLTVAGKNKEHLLLVEYEVSPAEPDVGDYGNGKEVITVERWEPDLDSSLYRIILG